MQAIYTRELTTNSSGFNFNNIPQTYDDLYVIVSGRIASGASYGNLALQVNGVTSGTSYYTHRLTGNGTGISSDRIPGNNFIYVGELNGDTSMANVFGICTMYIPNYAANTWKQILTDNISENSSTAAFIGLHSALIQNNAPITSLTFSGVGTLLAGTTFTLYGIAR